MVPTEVASGGKKGIEGVRHLSKCPKGQLLCNRLAMKALYSVFFVLRLDLRADFMLVMAWTRTV